MRRLAWLTEDFAEWDTGVWIHYSKEPFLKVNPRQLHQDPAGVYFFPEKFETKGQWRLFPYKFRASVDRLNVLDLSKLSGESAADLYEKVVPADARKLSREDFAARLHHPSPDPANTLWDAMREHFVLGKGRQGGQGGFGAWNRALRDAGYDAVFDDTGAIHGVEVQLIVLDPTKVDIIERVDQRSSGFEEMGAVTKELAALLAPYGKVAVEEPRRRRGMWSSSPTKLSASVRVEKVGDPDTYAAWGVEPVFSGGDATPSDQETVPREIRVYLEYSSPSLGYGAGAAVELGRRELDMGDLRRNVKNDMDAVWEKAKARVPEPLAASADPRPGRRLRWLSEAVAAPPKNPFPSSVVKDPVYHGTKQRFGRFEFRKGIVSVLGKEFEAERHAFFFTASKEEAATFGPTVLTAYVDLRNPLVALDEEPDFEDLAYILAPLVKVDSLGRGWLEMVTGAQIIGWDKEHSEEGDSYEDHPERWVYMAYTVTGLVWDVLDNAECVRRMKARGYDGSFVDEGQSATYGEGWSVAVFTPEQVEIVGHEDAAASARE